MPLLDPSSSSPESILKPYLDATLSLTVPSSLDSRIEPLFTTYYIQRLDPPLSPVSDAPSTVLITPPPSTLLPVSSDSAATNAEAVFREAVRALNSVRPTADSVNLDEEQIESLWPPMDVYPEEEAEEW
jgi:hypothetical protein